MSSEVSGIRCSLTRLLDGKKIALVVTASAAVYKSIDLARYLIRHGAEVKVVLTPRAAKLVSPELFRWATGSDVYVKLSGSVDYIDLAEWCDLCVVVPCTLNTLSKIVRGVTNNVALLTVQAVAGSGKRVLIVPCMNIRLWNSPPVKLLLETLRRYGNFEVYYHVEEGKVKFPDVELLCEKIIDMLAPRDMEGLTVLITAGATREYIDPVKYITTPSSGLMGAYLAREAAARGAKVFLVHGYLSERSLKLIEDCPDNVTVYFTGRTREMYEKVCEIVSSYNIDIAVFSAAPLDYELTSHTYSNSKIDSEVLEKFTLELTRAPKVIDVVCGKARVVVGFKAEWKVTDDILVQKAASKLLEKNIDIVVAHDVSRGLGFGTLRDTVLIIDKIGNIVQLSNIHKRELARVILNHALNLLRVTQ